jgi:hypothetical protein
VPAGDVLELWRYPVKSMRGEGLRSSWLDEAGLIGDRAHALMHERKGERKALTARQRPALLAWAASYPFAPDASLRPGSPPPATVTEPSGRQHRWGDPRLRNALAAALEEPDVELVRDGTGAHQDLPRTLLVTFEASRAAVEAEMGEPVEIRRFRPNVHVALDAPAWAEERWEGATLTFAGGVRLRLLHPCERCVMPTIDPRTQEKWPELLRHLAARHSTLFGVNARVLTGGRTQVGEAVELEAA